MKRQLMKSIVAALSISLLLGTVPVSVYAHESGGEGILSAEGGGALDWNTELVTPEDTVSGNSVSDNSVSGNLLRSSQAYTNLASDKNGFVLEMDGAGTDLDPGTGDITIREKEESILGRLTDGYLANGDVLDGAWNGEGERGKYAEFYRQVDRSITLDLGQTSHVNQIRIDMQEVVQYGIAVPAMVYFYLSEDGEEFHRVGYMSRFDAIEDTDSDRQNEGCRNYWFQADGLDYNARYVKVYFELSGTWAFADELEVMGMALPSETAQPLPDTPGTEHQVVNHYASPQQSGGIRHEGLSYAGYYKSSDGSIRTSEKTVEELFPMVAYVDGDGRVKDTFFDSITFLSHGLVPGADGKARSLLYDASSMNGNPQAARDCATITEWTGILDFLFDYSDGTDAAYNLDALEEAVGRVRKQPGYEDYVAGVKLAFYPPILCQNEFGALPGTDRPLNFQVSESNSREQALEDRLEASKWYLDETVRRFQDKGYENIRLDGFYWYDELMHYDVDPLVLETVQGVTDYVHSMESGFQIYWIPFYQSSGFRSWESFGFDYAVMQPNYAFDAHASSQRIEDTAALCYKYGLGVEMEFGGISDAYINAFKAYLEKGDELGYQNDSIVAWYTGTWGIYETSQNVSGTRYIYDAMYKFYQGDPVELVKPSENLAANGKLSLTASEIKNQTEWEGKLTGLDILVDGIRQNPSWSNGYLMLNRNSLAEGPFELTADLKGISRLTAISLDFFDDPGSGVVAPDKVSYQISTDGVSWSSVGEISREETDVTVVADKKEICDYKLALGDEPSARYVKAVFDHADRQEAEPPFWTWLAFDEYEIAGSVPVDSGEGIAKLAKVSLEAEGILLPEDFEARRSVAEKLLNDGSLQTGNWSKVNTEEGQYVGILQTVAQGPYSVILSFDSLVLPDSLGMDFLHWESAGVGRPDSVEYFASNDMENWSLVGTVTADEAVRYENIAAGMDAYHYVLHITEEKARSGGPGTKYIKAVFSRGTGAANTSGVYGWVAFDEFTVTGTITGEQPEKPTDPSEPTDPEEPTDPSEPTDPEEPTDPSEPTDPEEPIDPDEPSRPSEPDSSDDQNEPDQGGGQQDGEESSSGELADSSRISPKTGDWNWSLWIVTGLLAAILSLGLLYSWKKWDENN